MIERKRSGHDQYHDQIITNKLALLSTIIRLRCWYRYSTRFHDQFNILQWSISTSRPVTCTTLMVRGREGEVVWANRKKEVLLLFPFHCAGGTVEGSLTNRRVALFPFHCVLSISAGRRSLTNKRVTIIPISQLLSITTGGTVEWSLTNRRLALFPFRRLHQVAGPGQNPKQYPD